MSERGLPAACARPAKAGAFNRFAQWAAHATGQPATFGLAVAAILVWAVSGPVFGFSETWQLVINTGTTIVTFLMVFLIQNAQNRDSAAIQLKLDELIRSQEGAHNVLMDIENLSEEELGQIHRHYAHLAAIARRRLRQGDTDTARMLDSEDEEDTKPTIADVS